MFCCLLIGLHYEKLIDCIFDFIIYYRIKFFHGKKNCDPYENTIQFYIKSDDEILKTKF